MAEHSPCDLSYSAIQTGMLIQTGPKTVHRVMLLFYTLVLDRSCVSEGFQSYVPQINRFTDPDVKWQTKAMADVLPPARAISFPLVCTTILGKYVYPDISLHISNYYINIARITATFVALVRNTRHVLILLFSCVRKDCVDFELTSPIFLLVYSVCSENQCIQISLSTRVQAHDISQPRRVYMCTTN